METIQALGLQQRYQNEAEFAVVTKQFQALAFVPTVDVIPCDNEYLSSLSDELENDLSEFRLFSTPPHFILNRIVECKR